MCARACVCLCLCVTARHLLRDPTLNYLPPPLRHLPGVSGNDGKSESKFQGRCSEAVLTCNRRAKRVPRQRVQPPQCPQGSGPIMSLASRCPETTRTAFKFISSHHLPEHCLPFKNNVDDEAARVGDFTADRRGSRGTVSSPRSARKQLLYFNSKEVLSVPECLGYGSNA